MKIKALITFTAFSVILLLSCNRDEEANKNLDTAILAIEIPSETPALRNEVIVRSGIAKNADVEKVEFYVDDKLVETILTYPFEYKWNTEKETDTEHIVKCIAFGKNGDKVEKEIKVRVFNKLFKLEVSPHLITSYPEFQDYDFWVFASDSNGKVLGVEKIEPGKTIVFNTPENFEESTFRLTYFTKIDYFKGTSDEFYTYNFGTKLKWYPGEYKWEAVEPSTTNPEGKAIFNIDKLEPADYLEIDAYSHYSTRNSWNSELTSLTSEIGFASLETSGLIRYKIKGEEVPRYSWLHKVEDGKTYNLNAEEFIPMEVLNRVKIPDSKTFSYLIHSLEDNKTFPMVTYFNFGDAVTSHSVNVYTPTNNHKKKYTLGYYDDVASYYHVHEGEILEKHVKPDWSIKILNKSIENFACKTSGDFDLMSNTFSYKDNKDEFYWSMDLGKETEEVNYSLPEIPQQILATYPIILKNKLKYSQTFFSDYLNITDFQQYLDYIHNPQKNYSDNVVSVTLYPESGTAERRINEHVKKVDERSVNFLPEYSKSHFPFSLQTHMKDY